MFPERLRSANFVEFFPVLFQLVRVSLIMMTIQALHVYFVKYQQQERQVLHLACEENNLRTIHIFAKYYHSQLINIDNQTIHGKTVLQVACTESSWKVISYLIRQGANTSKIQSDDCAGNVIQVTKAFLHCQIDVNRLINNSTLLHEACIQKDYQAIKYLIQVGANPQKRNGHGRTPDYYLTIPSWKKLVISYQMVITLGCIKIKHYNGNWIQLSPELLRLLYEYLPAERVYISVRNIGCVSRTVSS